MGRVTRTGSRTHVGPRTLVALVVAQFGLTYSHPHLAEALLSKELNHPNLVRTFVTRCAELTPAFLQNYGDGPACGPFGQQQHVEHSGAPDCHDTHGDGYESDDGFGSPCANRVSSERALTWRDILFAVGGKEGDFISGGWASGS